MGPVAEKGPQNPRTRFLPKLFGGSWWSSAGVSDEVPVAQAEASNHKANLEKPAYAFRNKRQNRLKRHVPKERNAMVLATSGVQGPLRCKPG